jgi:hypothetical protein
MGRKRRGNGWTRAKKLPRTLETPAAPPLASAWSVLPAAPALDVEMDDEFAALRDVCVSTHAAPIECAPTQEVAQNAPVECVTPTQEVVQDAPIECVTPPQAVRDECAPQLEPEQALPPLTPPPTPVPLPRDDEVAATFRWRRPTDGRVLFPFRSGADCFRMVDMSRLADEFRQMFRRGEDSWCELVLVWLRRNKERVTLTFGELRAAAAAGHRNVMQLVRCYFETHDDAIPLIE